MGYFLYRTGLCLYLLLLRMVSPFHGKARDLMRGRSHLLKHIEQVMGSYDQVIWMHCASLGEFEQGREVLERFGREYPTWGKVITFYSPSGYNVRKDHASADHVFYLPVDSPANARRFLDLVRPDIAIFVKYEYWYHYFSELSRRNIPLYIISAIFRKDQVFFRWYGAFYRRMLKFPQTIFTQDAQSGELLDGIGRKNHMISGDTRFDRVWQIRSDREQLPYLSEFSEGNLVLVAGSTWEEDLEVMSAFLADMPDGVKCVIAPHEVSDANIKRIEDRVGRPLRYSVAAADNIRDANCLIIDSIGLLGHVYGYGHIAYIGGAFGKGLHNILEAATFGLPVIFGNRNYLKFREAVELADLGGAFPVGTAEAFTGIMAKLREPGERDRVSGTVAAYVQQNLGATELILSEIKKEL